jgi:uncharacterized protein
MILRFYKYWISPLLGNNCRFHPTCSVYASEAIKKHGYIKGGYFAATRLLNCHPWSPRRLKDPVP